MCGVGQETAPSSPFACWGTLLPQSHGVRTSVCFYSLLKPPSHLNLRETQNERSFLDDSEKMEMRKGIEELKPQPPF